MKPNLKYAVIHRHCERYPIKKKCAVSLRFQEADVTQKAPRSTQPLHLTFAVRMGKHMLSVGLCLSARLPAGLLVFFGLIGSFGGINDRL